MIGDPLLGGGEPEEPARRDADAPTDAVEAASADERPTEAVEAASADERPTEAVDGVSGDERPTARTPAVSADERPAAATAPPAPGAEEVPFARQRLGPDDEVPARTRDVPRPVLPPGELPLGPVTRPGPAPGSTAPPAGDVDPLWAATVAGAEPPPPGIAARRPPVAPVVRQSADPETELARLARAGSSTTPGDLAATTAMPAVGPAPADPAAPGRAAAGSAAADAATGRLAATTAIPIAAGDVAATTAMPGVRRSGGPHDTMVMPAVGPPGAQHADDFATAQRRHRRRWLRRTFKALAVLVLLALVYVGINFALVLRTAHGDQARPVDVIVVLGAAQYDGRPSPQLQARLDHTVELWNEGLAGAVFVTGGKQSGDRFTEAEASRRYLVDHGVPEEAIQMEDTAHSTWESFANLAPVAEAQGWERLLIVTDPFHSLRSRLIAQELGFTAYTSPTRSSPVQGGEELAKELKEALGISVGRIIGFERLWKLTG